MNCYLKYGQSIVFYAEEGLSEENKESLSSRGINLDSFQGFLSSKGYFVTLTLATWTGR